MSSFKLNDDRKFEKDRDDERVAEKKDQPNEHENNFESGVFFKPKLPKSFYIIKLREWAEEIPNIGLQSQWEDNIRQLILAKSRHQYPQRVQELLQEVKKIYDSDMQRLAIQFTVVNNNKNKGDDVGDVFTSNNFSTKNPYQVKRFVKHRNSLKENFFMAHSLMRQIIDISMSVLKSQMIVDFSHYHTLGLMKLSKMRGILKEDMRNGSFLIDNIFYKEIAGRISSTKLLRQMSLNVIRKFMRCATNLFVQQILYMKIRTVTHMINVIKYNFHCAQIEFELVFENESLTIKPSIEEVKAMYCDVIRDIENIGQELLLFEKYTKNNSDTTTVDNDYIRIKMPDWFVKQSQYELEQIIIDLLEPLSNYCCNIKAEFNYVYADETRQSIVNLIAGDYSYNIYYDYIKKFNTYLRQANTMVPFLHYRVGRLCQIQAKETLKDHISDIIRILVDKLVFYHWEYNCNICQQFDEFQSEAFDIPNNAKALFQLNDNMIVNSKIIVENLEKKINKSINILIILFDITTLTDRHIKLNIKTINCLSSINDIFVRSNTLCESMKSELEDELQKKIHMLNIHIENIFPTLIIINDMDDVNRVHEYIDYLEVLVGNIKQIDDKIEAINMEERLFKFPETQFSKVDNIKNMVQPFYSLNRMINEWKRYNSVWLDGSLEYISPPQVEKLINFYFDKFTCLNKSLKKHIKLDMSSCKLFNFTGIIDDPDPMQQPAPMKLCCQALGQINEFKQYMPLINCMCNSALRQRHWDEMAEIYGYDITPNAGATLRKLIALNLIDNIDKYLVISISANKELALQRRLENMYEQWIDVSFAVTYDQVGRLIFMNCNEIKVRLDEHLVIIEEMKGSYFLKPVAHQVEKYNEQLIQVRNIIKHFNIIQDECLFLRPIFTNSKISLGELVDAATIYIQVEETVNDMKENILHQPSFHDIAESPETSIKLLVTLDKIEVVNKRVYTYLNNMRLFFPRFFFQSDSELVMILFNEDAVERFKCLFRKCFQGVENLKVNSSKTIISAIISEHNEELYLKEKIYCNQQDTNDWIKLAEIAIIDAIRDDIHRCIGSIDIESNRDLIPMNTFSSGLSGECTIQLIWTSRLHKCFIKFHPQKLNSILNIQNLYINILIDNLRNELIIKKRIIVMGLMTVAFHQREIINLLILKNTSHNNDFNWIAQLRYYWNENDVIVGLMSDSRQYGYEFSTIIEPIIDTALTDRCYRTIAEVRRHHLFASLIGYSATGKTETIKGLTRAFAVPFHIINCSKNLSIEQISKIFKGLIACGTWVCFKNIDTARSSVLSAATYQIYLISQMLSSHCTHVSFNGSQLPLKLGGFIITTVNHHYSSLSTDQHQLPDNLRALFRVVAFRRPDISKICETRLFAAGFDAAKILADKINLIYKLCVEHFSYEKRYNFGCRALNTVLKSALNMKFGYPDCNEDTIVLRSLIDVNLPMFSNLDMIIFQQFLHDVFPKVSLPSPNYRALLKAHDQVIKKKNLQVHKVFRLKMIQVLEMTQFRHVVMLIGDALSGKTTLLRTLAQCLSNDIQLEIINQTSMTSMNLFGYLDEKSNRWFDGIYTALLRNNNRNNQLINNMKTWIIFDGPVESMWMNNFDIILNSNDDRTLALSTGETIEMSESISVILETDSVEEASPAIISRCGIIILEQRPFGYKHHIASWLLEQKFQDKYSKFIQHFVEWSLDSCLDFVYRTCQFIFAVEKIYLVISTLRLCAVYINNAVEYMDEKDWDNFKSWCQAAVMQSIVWTLSACLSTNSCVLFDEFCTSLWNNNDIHNPPPKEIMQYEVLLPSDGMIQDNTFIFKGTGYWKHWGDILKNECAVTQAFEFGFPFVLTIDTIKHMFILNNHIKYRIPFIVCGDTSTGKTTLMQYFLNKKLPSVEYMINCFNFTRTTVAQQAQHLFLLKLHKIMEDRYAPPKKKFCINFIDDFNIVSITDNCVERKSVTELIRQYYDHTYWYSVKKPKKLFINNVMFSCALTSNGSECGRMLCSRFIRHFNLITLHVPTRDNIIKIFSNTLLYSLKKNLFTADVMSSVNSMVNATIDVYTAIINKFKPIPINVHHQFNIRDVSRVINGCCLIHRESAETKVTLIRLWVHESIRVFGDRMTNEDDSRWLFSHIKLAIETHFNDGFESIFDHLPKENNQLTQNSMNNLVFVNFMEADKETNNRRYEEVGSIQLLKNKIIYYLNELNNNCKYKLDIILLFDTLEHLIRVCRILCIPGGNLLMICPDGSGRESLTRLAAYIERQDFFQYTSSQYFNLNEWRKNLKSIVEICGGIGEQCTFFIPSRYIKDTYFEDINSLMTTGEIPQLISPDEKQTIVKIARLRAQNGDRNLEIRTVDVMDFFFRQCREKLHFILYFNIRNCTNLRRQTQLYPSLLKYSYIDYFVAWSVEAFFQLGKKYIEAVSIENIIKEKIVIACKHFYDQSEEIRMNYYNKYIKLPQITPSAFIHMMKLYRVQISHKQQTLMAAKNKYLSGLEKLELVADEVIQMQEILRALRPELEFSARKTEETMREIESENVSVENATIQVKRDEEIANRTAQIAATLKSECEADLAVAIPILEDAIGALNTLKPSDITLVKAMKNPPDTVKLVMAAVCVMLDVAAERVIDPITGRKSMDYWGPSKRVLGDMNFLQTLKDYDKDNISCTVMQTIKKNYMTDKSFMPHIVTKASSAAEGLCKWVRAMVSYDEVAKIVAPKKEKLAAAEKECNECMVFLNETRKTLAALNDKLTALNVSLQATLTKKFELEKEVEICTQKLVKAEALITSLADEKSKWLESAEKLQQSYDNLAGDILISCGIIAFLAPYHSVYRNKSVTSWIKYIKDHLDVPCSSNYDFVQNLETEMKISSWHQCGLRKDRSTHENAVILNNSMQYCLFIDPQSEANMWIKEMEGSNQLLIVKLTDPNCLHNIVRNFQLDRSVLVEDIRDNELSAISINCILSQITNNFSDNCNSNKFHQHRGDFNNCNRIETMNNYLINQNCQFRLYMTTKLDNSRLNYYIFSKLTIVDFAVNEDALQNKLLDIVISREKPEIHEKFDILLDHSAANMRLLKQEEDNILTILSTSTVNILQDDKSMEILDISKNQSLIIMKKEKFVKIAKSEIDAFRKSYTEFARYCAILYSTLLPLSNLNCFYKFSIKWFIQVYVKSIMNSRRSAIIQQRLQYLMSSFTSTLHSSVVITLLNKHRLLYSLLLCLKIQIYTGHVILEEFNFFMSDNSCESIESDIDMSVKPHWLSENSWYEINLLSKISIFCGLENSIKNEESLWMVFYNSPNPKNYLLPPQWQKLLTPFHMLIIFKILRPDRIVIEIEHFVTNVNGSFNIHATQNLSDSYLESSCFKPLIFIIPSYVEPLKQVQEFAAVMGFMSKLTTLSLGDNMKEDASYAILQAQKQGEWVLLENCHLANTWMSLIEKIYDKMDASNTAVGFRLWLSTMVTPQFPIDILHNGIKIISDEPTCLKQRLIHRYLSDPLDKLSVFASCPGKDKILSKFIYAFTFFHVLVKERNYLGIHGWNVNYDFCHADLSMSISQLQSFIKNNDIIATTSLEPLLYLVGECIYGGKFIDSVDIRCLMTMFQDYCNTEIVLQDNYLFSVDYTIPDRCERRDYIEHIKNLPDYPSPELFGIDEYSLTNRNIQIVNDFFTQISVLNGSLNIDNSLLKKNIGMINVEMVRSKLPPVIDIEKAKLIYYEHNTLNGVLMQEVTGYNCIVMNIKESLLRPDDAFIRSLQVNTIPTRWYYFSIFCRHQLSVSNLIDRINAQYNFFYQWLNGECPISFWLGIFALPKRFISMTRVTFARHYKIPVDQLAFDYQVLSINSAPTHYPDPSDTKVLYLHGLYLSGASWNADDGNLIANNLKVTAQLMPVILWKPKFSREKMQHSSYLCPLYESNVGRDLIDHAGDSSNLITQILLPSNLREDYWIKRGTALFCQLV